MAVTVTLHTPPNSIKMSFAQSGAGVGTNVSEGDAWTWSVDEVISYICNPNNSVVVAVKPQNRPDLVALERALRENDIDGAALLVEVNPDTMRSYLGIKSLGHCATIKRIISALQVSSAGYLEHVQQTAALATSVPPITSIASRSADVVSPAFAENVHEPLPAAFRTQEWVKTSQTPLGTPLQNEPNSEVFNDAHTTFALSSPVADKNEKVSHQDEGHDSESCYQRLYNADPEYSKDLNAPNSIPGRASETHIVDETGRKRRRLDLTRLNEAEPTVSQPPSVEGEIAESVQSDQSVRNKKTQPPDIEDKQAVIQSFGKSSSPKPTSVHVLNKVGTVSRDHNGRKRLVPVSIRASHHSDLVESTVVHNHFPTKSITSARSQRNRRSGQDEYLGVNPLAIEDMIYGNIPKVVTDGLCPSWNMDFVILSSERDLLGESHGVGKRMFANKRMQYFLQSIPTEAKSGHGEKIWNILPYPDRLGRKYQSLSMTRLTHTGGDVIVNRINRCLLTQMNTGTLYGDDNNTFNLPGLPVDEPGQAPNWDLLEKWKYIDDDKVQPLYGDSGSENEYSLDLWREIEKEKAGKVDRIKPVSKRTLLGDSEVNTAIDDAITDYVKQWHVKRKLKLEFKSWRLWQRSRKNGTTKSQIRVAEEKIQTMKARLKSQRIEICRAGWRQRKDVVKSCRNMQPTIDDREEARWTVAVLRRKQAPAKPPRPEKKRPGAIQQMMKQEPLPLAKEDLEDDAVTTDPDSDSVGSLADFIESDENESLVDTNDEIIDTGQADDEEDEDHESAEDQKCRISTVEDIIQPYRRDSPRLVTPQGWSSQLVDLTQLSDPPETLSPYEAARAAPPTPPLHGGSESDDPFQRSVSTTSKKPPSTSNVIELSSDTDTPTLSPTLSRDLPPIEDAIAISKLDPKILEERKDRRRLQVYHVHKTPQKIRNQMMTMRQFNADDMWDIVGKALSGLKGGRHRLRGYSEVESIALMRIASLYVSWTIPVVINQSGLHTKDIQSTLIEGGEGFGDFYDCMLSCLKYYEPLATGNVDKDIKPTPSRSQKAKRQRLVSDDDTEADELYSTPSKKRKFHVPESQETLDMRALAQKRVKELKERQTMMQYRLGRFSVNTGDAAKVLVNVGEDHRKDIYLNPSIGKIIQPHQQEGLQFMWRELTTDHEKLQGCLLAQTMGLGKTMQVVSVLVTIAEASKSSDDCIRDQVPKQLRESRTLILCPPALIENWYEELLMWAPPPRGDNVGEIRKVSSAMKPRERFAEILAWKAAGGILILGYIGFRDLVKHRDDAKAPTKQHAEIIGILLDYPNIVVADEAHFFKNLNSAAGKAVNDIRCKSRIALTGSPLSNNLNEYYAIVDWVAPGYLGNFTEFRANFTEPIEAGLYVDSTQAEYRNSRKRLQALQSDLEPKVHRADASILKARLKGKIEFIIKVALTPFQERVYHDFVRSTYGALGNRKEMETETATLWAWIFSLRLLCNHPSTFERHLRAIRSKSTSQSGAAPRKQEAKRKSAHDSLSPEEDTDPMNLPPATGVISCATIERLLALFKDLPIRFNDSSLSHKVQVLDQILKLSQIAGDKCLIFSHSIPTLDYIEDLLQSSGLSYCRIDGQTGVAHRQKMCKAFNTGPVNVCIISTRAGGQGLNMFGANRVVIMDSNFNPMWEEQAIGRAYRIGQAKTVYVYHLIVGGTFEDGLHHQAIFKQQLATRVVDKKHPNRYVERGVGQYLHPPKAVEQKDLSPLRGKDQNVLDPILEDNMVNSSIRSIELTETFHEEDDYQLTPEEQLEAKQMQKHYQLRRTDPEADKKAVAEKSSFQVPVAPETKIPSNISVEQSSPVTTTTIPAIDHSNFRQLGLAGSKSFNLTSRAVHTLPATRKPPFIAEGSAFGQLSPFFGVGEPRPIVAGSTVLSPASAPAEIPPITEEPSPTVERSGIRQLTPNTVNRETKPMADGSTILGTTNSVTEVTTRNPEGLQSGLQPERNKYASSFSGHSIGQTLSYRSDPNFTQSAFLAAFAFLDVPDRSQTDQHWLSHFGMTHLLRLQVELMRILMADNAYSTREIDICRGAIAAFSIMVCARSVDETHCIAMYSNAIEKMASTTAFREIFYEAFRVRHLYEIGKAVHGDLMIPVLRLMAGGDSRKMHHIRMRLKSNFPTGNAASSLMVHSASEGSGQHYEANTSGRTTQASDSRSDSGFVLGGLGQPTKSAEEESK